MLYTSGVGEEEGGLNGEGERVVVGVHLLELKMGVNRKMGRRLNGLS